MIPLGGPTVVPPESPSIICPSVHRALAQISACVADCSLPRLEVVIAMPEMPSFLLLVADVAEGPEGPVPCFGRASLLLSTHSTFCTLQYRY